VARDEGKKRRGRGPIEIQGGISHVDLFRSRSAAAEEGGRKKGKRKTHWDFHPFLMIEPIEGGREKEGKREPLHGVPKLERWSLDLLFSDARGEPVGEGSGGPPA